jgi:hypothetical protein
MRTVGVDLAADQNNTAIAVIEWHSSGATVIDVEIPADDDAVLRHADGADKMGIDCPLGWPDKFVDFLVAHRDNAVTLPADPRGAEWRRSLANRHTDLYVRNSPLGLIPLSVAADRIGICAMRAARLQVLLAQRGHAVDRAGTGLIVEVYPAAGLKYWGLTHRRYKGSTGRTLLHGLVDELQHAAPWLDLGECEQVCRTQDHALDAVLSGLLARAAALGRTVPPPAGDLARARREGWIALPTCTLDDLRTGSA